MKIRTILALTLVLSFVLGGIAMATDIVPEFYPMCRGSDPGNYLNKHPDPADCFISTGDAMYECTQIGEYDFAKRTGAVNGEWPLVETGTFLQWVRITECDGFTFNWEAWENPVGAVIVKSVGQGMRRGGYYVYSYDPALKEDDGLYGVDDLAINHITFCWDEEGVCMQDETAWAAGLEFDPDAGWAMYVPYYGEELIVDLMAGQHTDAGDVIFSAPVDGWVTITIILEPDWIFYYDIEDDELDNNIKVQDYEYEPDASTSTAPGLFDWKVAADIDDASFTITVPENNFYAVHVDLATGEPCE